MLLSAPIEKPFLFKYLCRDQIENRKVYAALNSMSVIPSFAKDMQKFVYKEVSKEAGFTAKEMQEGRPALLTREKIDQFSFSRYCSCSFSRS